MTSTKTQALYADVTAHIIEALEAGASEKDWHAPWHVVGGGGLPYNLKSKKDYRGINTLILWTEQLLHGYTSEVWGTFKQWKEAGAQVQKRPENVPAGAWGTKIFLWKPTKRKVADEKGEETTKASLFATTYTVFNADQVDGWDKRPDKVEPNPFDVIEHASEFLVSLGAKVTHGGARAYYAPATDGIYLPEPNAFKDNVSYYATSAHEHVHWTGHKDRCDRDLVNRFGTASYAAEELVAELGAAYVCAHLGLVNEPRSDHAQYLASWLQLLKDDPSALITAASKAQQSVDWLIKNSSDNAEADDEDVVETEALALAVVS